MKWVVTILKKRGDGELQIHRQKPIDGFFRVCAYLMGLHNDTGETEEYDKIEIKKVSK